MPQGHTRTCHISEVSRDFIVLQSRNWCRWWPAWRGVVVEVRLTTDACRCLGGDDQARPRWRAAPFAFAARLISNTLSTTRHPGSSAQRRQEAAVPFDGRGRTAGSHASLSPPSLQLTKFSASASAKIVHPAAWGGHPSHTSPTTHQWRLRYSDS